MEREKITAKTASYSVNITGNQVDSLRVNHDKKTTVRVYENGRIGVAGQIGNADEGEIEAQAKENLAQEIAYPCNLTENTVREEDKRKKIPTGEELVSAVKSLVARLVKEFPDFIFSNKVNTQEFERTYENSKGTKLTGRGNYILPSVIVKAKSSANIMDFGYGAVRAYYNEDEIVSDIGKLIGAYGKTAELPKDVPVILPMDAISYAIGEFIAEKYVSGASLFQGKLGEKLFGDNVNILIDRFAEDNYSEPFFDAEGVVNPESGFPLVENGVFQGLLTYKRSAANFNLPLSGSAASGYDSVPSFGVGGLSVKRTHESLKDVVKGKAIYVCVTSGGDMTPNGDIGLPVQLAYLYEDGKLLGKLPEFGVNVNLFDLLGKELLGICKCDLFDFADDDVIVANCKIS